MVILTLLYQTNTHILNIVDISDEQGKEKMRLYWSKEAKGYRLKKVYKKKDFSFKTEILQAISLEAMKPTPKQAGVSNKYLHFISQR